MTISLSLESTFGSGNGGDGITRLPNGNVLVFDSIFLNPEETNPALFEFDWNATELTTQGEVVSTFGPDTVPLTLTLGVDTLPNGNILISSPRDATIAELTESGEAVDGGINITDPSIQTLVNVIHSGVTFDPDTNTIWGVDFINQVINQFDATQSDAVILNTIDLTEVVNENLVGQGIALDPGTGNLLVADDNGGNNQIHEITTDGELVGSIDISDFGLDDPEGLYVNVLDDNTRQLYVVFDSDEPDGTPVDNPLGNQVALFTIEDSPEVQFNPQVRFTLVDQFDVNSPDGLVFDPVSGNLFAGEIFNTSSPPSFNTVDDLSFTLTE
jgi:hypothetical protein